MNNERLLILATFLETKAVESAFLMETFGHDFPAENTDQELSCGTCACALGHAPLLFKAEEDETWQNYCRRVFGIREDTSEWNWCFSPFWDLVDNTPKGAAARIRYMIRNRVPVNYEDQIRGDARLSYTV